jgi:zinc/manganese transport system substrate-binding protein
MAACLLLAGLAPITAQASEPIQVTASFSILADIVRAVGAERVKVTALVGPDEDAHVFEPKPADAKTILQSRLVVMNGLGFEPWMLKLLKSSGYKGDTLEASKGVKPRTMPAEDGKGLETDPHAWQDPTNVIVYVQNIAQALTELDPAGASQYQKNAAEYTAELKTLDDWAKTQMSSVLREKRKVITSHDAFGYFAAHYNVTILAPQGVSTETEPSAKEVARLIRQIKHDKIKAVFMENMSNPKLISQIAVDTGVTLGPELFVDALSAKGDAGTTYLKLMRHNVAELVKAMQKN